MQSINAMGIGLLSNVLASTIKLYVRLTKEKLELQVEVDAFKEMDMCTKVKKLSANMQKQVAILLRPFLDFMDCFKLSKVHNMVIFMLDLQFKDLNIVGDYVGHSSTIGITTAYDREVFFPTFKILYQKHHGQSNVSSPIVQETMYNTNVIFGIGAFEDELCFEQVKVVSQTFLIFIYKTL